MAEFGTVEDEGLYSDSALKALSFNSGSILRRCELSRRHRSVSGLEYRVAAAETVTARALRTFETSPHRSDTGTVPLPSGLNKSTVC